MVSVFKDEIQMWNVVSKIAAHHLSFDVCGRMNSGYPVLPSECLDDTLHRIIGPHIQETWAGFLSLHSLVLQQACAATRFPQQCEASLSPSQNPSLRTRPVSSSSSLPSPSPPTISPPCRSWLLTSNYLKNTLASSFSPSHKPLIDMHTPFQKNHSPLW